MAFSSSFGWKYEYDLHFYFFREWCYRQQLTARWRVVPGGVRDPDPGRGDGKVVHSGPALGRQVTSGEELLLSLLCLLDCEGHDWHGWPSWACLPGWSPGWFSPPRPRPSLPPLLATVKHRVELQHWHRQFRAVAGDVGVSRWSTGTSSGTVQC